MKYSVDKKSQQLRGRHWTGRTCGVVAGFLNIGFLIEGNPLCSRIRGTRTARAKRTKAPDGFLLRYIIFEVTQTQGPLRAAQREI